MANKARTETKKLLGKEYYGSRLAVADNIFADTSSLNRRDVKSHTFVVLVVLRRGKTATQSSEILPVF